MKRLTLVVENGERATSEITYLLTRARICIDEFCTLAYGGKLVVHIMCKPAEKAKALLESNGYNVFESDRIVVARIPWDPAEKAKIFDMLVKNKIACVDFRELASGEGYSIVAFGVNKVMTALKLFKPFLLSEVAASQLEAPVMEVQRVQIPASIVAH